MILLSVKADDIGAVGEEGEGADLVVVIPLLIPLPVTENEGR